MQLQTIIFFVGDGPKWLFWYIRLPTPGLRQQNYKDSSDTVSWVKVLCLCELFTFPLAPINCFSSLVNELPCYWAPSADSRTVSEWTLWCECFDYCSPRTRNFKSLCFGHNVSKCFWVNTIMEISTYTVHVNGHWAASIRWTYVIESVCKAFQWWLKLSLVTALPPLVWWLTLVTSYIE